MQSLVINLLSFNKEHILQIAKQLKGIYRGMYVCMMLL